MLFNSRSVAVVASLLAAALLSACAHHSRPAPYPAGGAYYPEARPGYAAAPVGVEYGRVGYIEVLQGRAPGQTTGAGAVVGAVVGGLLGNQVGRGSGRAAATAVGVLGGAVAGNAIEGQNNSQATHQGYRITVQLDQGGARAFDVPHPGDLRVGDRVRLQGGQISRM